MHTDTKLYSHAHITLEIIEQGAWHCQAIWNTEQIYSVLKHLQQESENVFDEGHNLQCYFKAGQNFQPEPNKKIQPTNDILFAWSQNRWKIGTENYITGWQLILDCVPQFANPCSMVIFLTTST